MISSFYFRKKATLTIIYLILYTFLGVYSQVSKASQSNNDTTQRDGYSNTVFSATMLKN